MSARTEHDAPRGLQPGAMLIGVALLCIGALAVAMAVAGGSTLQLGAALVALAGGAWVLWTRQVQLWLVAGLFFLAPVDISKAIVAPEGQYYSPGLYLTPAHAVLLLLAAWWAASRRLVGGRWPPLTGLDMAALGWAGYLLLRSFGSAQGELAVASGVAYALAVLGFYVASHALQAPGALRIALQASVAVLLIEAVYVLAQLLTRQALPLPGAKGLTEVAALTFGGEGLAFRPTGFFGHPNSLAHHLSLLLPPLMALALVGRTWLPVRVWWVTVATLLVAGVMQVLTLSRSGWVALVVGGLVVVVGLVRCRLMPMRAVWRLVAAAVAAVVMVVILYPQAVLRLTAPDDRSLESRGLLNGQAMTMITDRPWLGVGFGEYNRASSQVVGPQFAQVSEDYQKQLRTLVVHNHYLLLAAELGVPAMFFFLGLLACMIALPWPLRRWCGDPASLALAIGLSGSLVGQLLFLTADNFYAETRVFMLWLTAGVLQAVVLRQRPAPRGGAA